MDGRRRQSTNSGPASTAPLISPYYAGNQPLTPTSDTGSGFSPRGERFWTNNNGGGRQPSPDPWASSGGYIPQLLPPPSAQDGLTPNYSPASHHSLNNNNSPPGGSTFNLNIPSHSPYPPGHNGNQPPNGLGLGNIVNGNSASSGSSDMSSSSPFSGPSPPNQAIPLSSPYGAPPNSNSPRSRQYTPSTTPSPHVIPHQTPPANLNGVNGNSHSSHDNSPNSVNNGGLPFDGYINGSLESQSGVLGKNGGPNDLSSQPHPNELPGYPPHPQQSLQNSGRYPGESKSLDGEMVHGYHHQQQSSYYHPQNYAASYPQQQHQQNQHGYYDSYGPSRRPFDPYHPYPNPQSGIYGENSYSGDSPSSQQYNSSNVASNPSNRAAVAAGNPREPKHSTGENGNAKIDSCESLQGGPPGPGKEGYEEDPNFEAVLQGHINNYNLDNRSGFGSYGGHNAYEADRVPHSEDSNFPVPPNRGGGVMEKSESQSQDSSKSDDSNNSSSRQLPANRREKPKKKRSKGRPSADIPPPQLKTEEDEEGGSKEIPFLGIDNSGSPKALSRSSELGPGRGLDERSNSSSSTNFPFSDGGPSNNSPGGASNVTPTTDQKPSTSSSRKKKPWRKTKPINSEQLLEERERHCAEYVESTERSLEKCKDGKSLVKLKDVTSYYPHHHNYEERNITIDHQKDQKESSELPKKEVVDEKTKDSQSENSSHSHATTDEEEVKKEKKDVPMVECGCFPVDEVHPEPGPFYTHLGAAHTLPELRETLEIRTGFRAGQLRFEKVIYTGKEGKTSQGCPLAKWIIRRGSYEEQLLFLVKHRKGHKCATAWIVVCCVIWEGVPPHFADNVYDTLVYKLNRFGIPTTRRSDTNEQRSCACQGVDPDTCGQAYSFGCAWSMFFNGCKYARSRNVRKFRLTEEHEEAELEEKVSHLATHLGPLYERVAPDSYKNQIEHENEGLECRLGYRPGRPFSGVTACVDYCSHAHKDAHNMINGCTVTVAFTRNRSIAKGDDEQYHVLPLYKLDDSDELGSKEGQKQKIKKGQLEILKKFPSKIRVRKVPLLPSRRRGKVKPPSGSSSSHAHHHHHQAKTSDLYSSDHGTLAMPPPMKREKLSIFEELNGPSGGSDLFDTRFHHPGPPPPFNPDGTGSSLWNHPSPYGQGGHHTQQSGPPFRSYFDSSSMIPPPTTLSTPTSQYAPTSVQFGHNLDLNLGGSSRRGSSGMQSSHERGTGNTGSHQSPSHGRESSGNVNSSSSGGNSATPMTTPGYTSLSPSILPSFRHTFMTEAESLSMLSAMSSPPTGGPGGSPMADSTSSPRGGKSSNSSGPSGSSLPQNSSTSPVSAPPSGSFNHQETLGYQNSSSGYFGSSSSSTGNTSQYSAPPNSSLYHPQPHHATPASCLSSPPSQSGGSSGVSFNSSGYSPGSSFGPPPPSMDPHHPAAFGGMSAMNPMAPWNPNMNMNASGYSHSAYGASQAPNPYHSHHNQMSSLNMNPMSSPHFQHMNQYSPYGNQPNFSSMAAAAVVGMHHSHHHSANPWANPLPTFGSHMAGHHHAPPPPSCFVAPPKPKVIPEVNETYSDNEDAFKDPQLGGVAIALTHGSVILQCAKHEMHATTSLKAPNRLYPSRICLVFYQHKSMNNRFHGWSEWEKKIEAKKLQEVKLINQGKLEASPRKMKQLIKEGYIADNL